MSNFLDNYDRAFIDAFDREYQSAEVQSASVTLPEGRYQFLVTDVVVIDRANTNIMGLEADQYYENMLVIDLKVLTDGPYKGARTSKYNGICLANIKRIKGDLQGMGVEFEGLEKLALDIERGVMIGLIVDGRVTVKASKKNPDKLYSNIWLTRCVGRMSPEEMQGGFTPVEDDELPWGGK